VSRVKFFHCFAVIFLFGHILNSSSNSYSLSSLHLTASSNVLNLLYVYTPLTLIIPLKPVVPLILLTPILPDVFRADR